MIFSFIVFRFIKPILLYIQVFYNAYFIRLSLYSYSLIKLLIRVVILRARIVMIPGILRWRLIVFRVRISSGGACLLTVSLLKHGRLLMPYFICNFNSLLNLLKYLIRFRMTVFIWMNLFCKCPGIFFQLL